MTVHSIRVRAHNDAFDHENKIHDDRVAVAYGFHGGLVPGVTIYGYMIPPVLEKLGRNWLERGAITVRFHAPCYEGETVVASCDGSEVSAKHQNGSLYASGVVSLHQATEESVCPFPAQLHPLPETNDRPIASVDTIVPGKLLGSVRRALDAASETTIPERLLRMANEILVRNFRLGPWIHAGSEVRHHRLAKCGQEITVTGVIQ